MELRELRNPCKHVSHRGWSLWLWGWIRVSWWVQWEAVKRVCCQWYHAVTIWIDKHKWSLGCFPTGFPGPCGDGVAGFWSQVCWPVWSWGELRWSERALPSVPAVAWLRSSASEAISLLFWVQWSIPCEFGPVILGFGDLLNSCWYQCKC